MQDLWVGIMIGEKIECHLVSNRLTKYRLVHLAERFSCFMRFSHSIPRTRASHSGPAKKIAYVIRICPIWQDSTYSKGQHATVMSGPGGIYQDAGVSVPKFWMSRTMVKGFARNNEASSPKVRQ